MRHADAPDGAAGADDPIDVSIAWSVPTHSRTEWTPKPPVSSRTRSMASSPRSLTTSVAPNSLRERDPVGVAAHDDDLLGPEALGGDDAAQADRAVADDGDACRRATRAATAAWWPVPITSESVSSDGISASSSPTSSG